MLPLPPLPQPPPLPLTPPPQRKNMQPPPPSPLTTPPQRQNMPQNRIKETHKPGKNSTGFTIYQQHKKTKDQPLLRPPRRTNPVIWFGAVLCLIFSLTPIFSGIATLIIFLGIKPRKPLTCLTQASASSTLTDQ